MAHPAAANSAGQTTSMRKTSRSLLLFLSFCVSRSWKAVEEWGPISRLIFTPGCSASKMAMISFQTSGWFGFHM
jgi:hypothetical protein